jgi:hypothetical protein
MKLLRTQQERLWNKCVRRKRGRFVCWEFMGATDKDGYGKFTITAPAGQVPKQKHIRSHQASWALKTGRLPRDGEVVMHSCDNPPCCNPAHLKIGDETTNRRQRLRRTGS